MAKPTKVVTVSKLRKDVAQLREENHALKREQNKYQQWMLSTAAGEKFSLPDPSTYSNQADLFRKLSWVLAAVDMTAQAASLTNLQVMRIISDKEPKDIPNHPFEQCLLHPNPLDSRFEFLYATVAFMKLTGNSYWWMSRANPTAPPDELWLIPSHMIIPIPDERMYLKGYLYSPGNGSEFLLEPWQIVHFRRFNPFSRFVGMSAIESIALVAQGDIGMQDWNTRLFKENNARLPGILTFQSLVDDPAWEKIKKDTVEASRKREMLMLRGVGEGGVNWLQNSVTQKEMEFLAGRKANKEEIWAVLAPGLSSILDVNATEANARTGRSTFNEYTVYPMHVMMAEKITNEILPAYGGRPIIAKFEDIRITDRQLELQEQEKYSETHTIEEIRKKFYGDSPLGDERDGLLPTQLKTASAAPVEEEEPKTPEQMPVPPEPQPGEPPKEPGEEEEEEEQNIAAKAIITDELGKWQRKAMKKIGEDVSFESMILDPVVMTQIHEKLPECESQDAIKALFSFFVPKVTVAAKTGAKPEDIVMLLQGIEQGVKAIELTKQPVQVFVEPTPVTVEPHVTVTPVIPTERKKRKFEVTRDQSGFVSGAEEV